ncbi:hypothetical protein Q3C01_01090 [Bradyrhizobium sp. UFLA05-109]
MTTDPLAITSILGASAATLDQYEAMKPAERAAYAAEREKREFVARHVVFGHDHKLDENGSPVEQGHGAPGRESPQHWAALLLAERRGDEPAGTTARMKAEAERRKSGAKA